MRVTSTSTYISMRNSLGTSLARVVDTQAQLGTMRRINKVSDDPVGAATALRYRSYESQQDGYARAADNASTWLARADTELSSVSARLIRVREIAVGAGNAALSPQGRDALAAEAAALRDEIAALANSTHEGQALFGGFAETAVGRDAQGAWTYTGDGGSVQRRVGEGVTVAANVDGRAVLGFDQPAGQDLLSVLDRLVADVRSGDPAALADVQGALAGRTQAVLSGLGTVGATVNRVEAVAARGKQFVEQISLERSTIEDVDVAEAVLKLQIAQNGYQAALGAVAKSDLPSLADFLR
jgi:flagellar hook-associated protein 3 FlgL